MRSLIKPSSYKLFGFSFWQAWWVVSMCSDIILPGRSLSNTLLNPFFIITIFTTFGYLVIVIISRWFGPFSSKKYFFAIAGGFASLGSFGMAFFSFPYATADFSAVFIIFVVLFSLGNALLLIMWGELWSSLATSHVGKYLYASYAFAFVLYFLILLVPHFFGAVIASLFPMTSAAILLLSQNEPRRNPSQVDFDIKPFSPIKIALAVISLGFAHGFAQRFLNVSGGFPLSIIQLSQAMAFFCILALVVYMMLAKPPAEPFVLYKPIIPGFAIGLILLAILPNEYAFLGNGLILFAVFSLDMLVMLVSTDIAFRTRKPVALFFGLSLFGMRFGTTLASASVYFFTMSIPLTTETSSFAFLLCSILVIIVGTLIFTQVDLMKLYVPKSTTHHDESISEKCDFIAKNCGLTSREKEILCLLALGRSGPYISKELFIAESTVKNHISSIYRKIGVYDRQSLMDVVLSGAAGKGSLVD